MRAVAALWLLSVGAEEDAAQLAHTGRPCVGVLPASMVAYPHGYRVRIPEQCGIIMSANQWTEEQGAHLGSGRIPLKPIDPPYSPGDT